MKWIAAAYDSARVCEIGKTPEEAEALYEAQFGRPRYGFWRFSNRDEYKKALEGIGVAMGHTHKKSIQLVEANQWICVTPITQEAVRAVQLGGLRTLVNDWTDPAGGFQVTIRPPASSAVPEPTKNELFDARFAGHMVNSSERLRRMTKYRDLEQLSWDIDAGREPELTDQELEDVVGFYDKVGMAPVLRMFKKKP